MLDLDLIWVLGNDLDLALGAAEAHPLSLNLDLVWVVEDLDLDLGAAEAHSAILSKVEWFQGANAAMSFFECLNQAL
jgi:hypothetical protein